jgi:hypothetical protein
LFPAPVGTVLDTVNLSKGDVILFTLDAVILSKGDVILVTPDGVILSDTRLGPHRPLQRTMG